MPRLSVNGEETEWVIRSAFVRFDVDRGGIKAVRAPQTHAASLSSIAASPLLAAMLGMKKPTPARFPRSG
jgi:hypothetical protein